MSIYFTTFGGFVIDKPRISKAGDRWSVSGDVVEHRPGLHPLVQMAATTFAEACQFAKECFRVREK